MTIRVISGGLQTTVQDLGRQGHQRSAIPVGGAMDSSALRLANLLVGNAESDACLEAALIGPTLLFEHDAVIAITGGDLDAAIGDTRVPCWHTVRVPAGASLHFGRPRAGCRAYIAVAGGIEVPPVFGSRSTYVRASFGGLDGRALRASDVLRVGPTSSRGTRLDAVLRALGGVDRVTVSRWSIARTLRPRYSDCPTVDVVAGAHAGLLTDEAQTQFTSAPFHISSTSDRMGYRLEGVSLGVRERLELMSEGVAFGTIQLPPDGSPIVLMADCQTTGGYPRIGEIASVDLPLVAQLKPGDHLRFRSTSVSHAQQRYVGFERDLSQARLGLDLRRA